MIPFFTKKRNIVRKQPCMRSLSLCILTLEEYLVVGSEEYLVLHEVSMKSAMMSNNIYIYNINPTALNDVLNTHLKQISFLLAILLLTLTHKNLELYLPVITLCC